MMAPHISLRFIHVLTVVTCTVLASCSGLYEVSLNDRLIYDPLDRPPPAGPDVFADAGLQGCLNELLNRSEDLSLEELTQFACPESGIETLVGIDTLSSLEQVELSQNDISDLSPLSRLSNLRVANLQNNNIRDVRPLMNLKLLRFVSLQGNDSISCRQLDQLEESVGSGLNRPLNCIAR